MTGSTNEVAPSQHPETTDRGTNVVGIVVLLVAAVALFGVGVLFITRGDDDASDGSTSGDRPEGSNSGSEDLAVEDAWTTSDTGLVPVYLTIHNSDDTDHLVDAASEVSGTITLMGGDVEMDRDGTGPSESVSLEIPPGTTALQPGDAHLMLHDLDRDLQAGEQVRLQLSFEDAGTIDVDVEVRPEDG